MITAKLISELREMTSAGMMDCKEALTENNGDLQLAADWLRQKGIVKAAKKADRVAAAGLVSAKKSECGKNGVIVELNVETDFVAKNEKFQKLVSDATDKALEFSGDFDAVVAAMDSDVKNAIATIGENMGIRRIKHLTGDYVATYVHNQMVPGMGQIGVVVALNGDLDKATEMGPKIAMHIAATKPEFATVADVDPAAADRETKVFVESGKTEGKPAEVAEKMIAGNLKKWYGESVLVEQPFVMEPGKTVGQILEESGLALAGFAYYVLGSGIEKGEDNLADEVAKMLK
ncbi:MAG: translation elongation factor Ts [Alphaproteobacteria bacterium]|nr:translation elongation factor Ts [Alphaproteobacteria bacterium]